MILFWTFSQWMLCVPSTSLCILGIRNRISKCASQWPSQALLCECGVFSKAKSVKLSPDVNDAYNFIFLYFSL